jgi:hypothetical protein
LIQLPGPRVEADPLLQAALAHLTVLLPAVAEHLDAVALLVGIVAPEMAVGLEADDAVTALEEELFKITHGSSFYIFDANAVAVEGGCVVFAADL